ncbi:MAG: aminopeptidase P family protein [Chloroflexi bacterium]|nr:aminopeptidase P family protein [Chloroflexota bacterium]
MERLTDKAERFARRRQRLMSQMDTGIAWINAAGEGFNYEKDKNLEYLTGLHSAEACLILAPGGVLVEGISHPGHYWFTEGGSEYGRGRCVQEALFVEPTAGPWGNTVVHPQMPTLEEVRALTGVEAVYPLWQMDEVLRQALWDESTLWVNTANPPSLGGPLSPDVARINAMRERFYWLELRNIAPLIHAQRLIKEPYELECIRTAYQISKEVIETLMRAIRPGDNEAKAVGLWEYEVKRRVGEGPFADLHTAFGPIVSSGRRSSTNTYWASNQTIADGEMILIDCGVSYQGYAADISRAWPANGRFTPRQRQVYSIVLEGQDRGLVAFKPGGNCREARRLTWKCFQSYGVAQHGLGRNCHPVGLNVEDADYFNFGDYGCFAPDQVWAFEPMLMMQEEGIGIRLEDGVLITAGGHELLPAPERHPDAVEALCAVGG